jgi:hypothetical protein
MNRLTKFGAVSSVLVSLLGFGSDCKAQSLGDYWGYAKTFTSFLGGLIGSTTVTPAHSLYYWQGVT